MDIIHCLALESLPKMQAQSLFLLITHKGLRPNSESRLPQCPFLGFQYPFEKKRTAKANPTTRFHYQRETLQKKMQNTRRNTLVFVQGLPKCLRAFPQHSGPCQPPGWFPAEATGALSQAPGRAQGKAPPGTAAPQVKPCPSSQPCWPAEKVEQALGCVQGSEEEALLSPEQ